MAGYPVKSPAIDVSAIGAGGGSIAWIDDGGALKVGPHSAGAFRGPLLMGWGENITLTDANLILGRLNPSTLLAGDIALDLDKAYVEMKRQISTPLGLSVEAAATGIIKIASSGIARAIRGVASAKGNSPSEFSLLPMVGPDLYVPADVNEEVGCPRIIIPPPGTYAHVAFFYPIYPSILSKLVVLAEVDGWEVVMDNLEALKEQANKLFIGDEVYRMLGHSNILKLVIRARVMNCVLRCRAK